MGAKSRKFLIKYFIIIEGNSWIKNKIINVDISFDETDRKIGIKKLKFSPV